MSEWSAHWVVCALVKLIKVSCYELIGVSGSDLSCSTQQSVTRHGGGGGGQTPRFTPEVFVVVLPNRASQRLSDEAL